MRIAFFLLIGITAFPLLVPLRAQEKPRVWVAPSSAWRTHGSSNEGGGEVENRTVEISTDFGRSCKDVVVNADVNKANYVVEVNHRTKYVGVKIDRTDVAVYRWNADLVGGASKSSVGAAVKAACEIINKDWPAATHDLRPSKDDQERKPTKLSRNSNTSYSGTL